MTLIFTVISSIVLFIFLFRREILFNKKSYLTLLLCGAILSAFYLCITLLDVKIRNIQMLVIPLLQLLIFFILSKVYKLLFGVNPVDTFWSNDMKLMKDGLFNFLFWVLSIIVPVFIVFKIL